MSYTNPWLDEAKVALLKQLYAEGHSASHIAARIGGVSRNAVIGKAHRLGLVGNAPLQRKMSQRSRSERNAIKKKRWRRPMSPRQNRVAELFASEPFAPAPEIIFIPENERKTLVELGDRECRWPLGDPKEPSFGFCGRPQEPGLSYCRGHAKVAYQPPVPRQRPAPAQPVSTNASHLEEVG